MEVFGCVHTAGDENDILLITGCEKCDYGTLHSDRDGTSSDFYGLDGIEIEEGLIESLGLGETITAPETRIDTPDDKKEQEKDIEMATETHNKITITDQHANDEQSKATESKQTNNITTNKPNRTKSSHKTKHNIPTRRRHVKSNKMPLHRNEKRPETTANNIKKAGLGAAQVPDEYGLRFCIECEQRPALSRLADGEHKRAYIRVVDGNRNTKEYKLITNFPMSIIKTKPNKDRLRQTDPNQRYPYWQDTEFYTRIRNYVHSRTLECSPHKQLKQLDINARLIINDIEYETENGPHLYDIATRKAGPPPRHFVTAEQESWPQTYDSEYTVYITIKYDLDLTSSIRIQQSQDLYKNFLQISDDKENTEKLIDRLMKCYNAFHENINNDLRKTITELKKRKEHNIKTEFDTLKPTKDVPEKKKDFHKDASANNNNNHTLKHTTLPKRTENTKIPTRMYTHPNATYKHPYHPSRTTTEKQQHWKDSNHLTHRTTRDTHTHQNRFRNESHQGHSQYHQLHQQWRNQNYQERDGTTYHMSGNPSNHNNVRHNPYRRTLLQDPRPNRRPQLLDHPIRRPLNQNENGTNFGNGNHQNFKMRTNRQMNLNNYNYNTDKSERRFKEEHKMQH